MTLYGHGHREYIHWQALMLFLTWVLKQLNFHKMCVSMGHMARSLQTSQTYITDPKCILSQPSAPGEIIL